MLPDLYVSHTLIQIFMWHTISPIQEESSHLGQQIKAKALKIFQYFIQSFQSSYKEAGNQIAKGVNAQS